MVERVPTEIVEGDSIRVLTIHSCPERCFFCHNEGSADYLPARIDVAETVDFAKKARKEFGLGVVHLTGGEPTLHPQIVDLVSKLKQDKFRVQLTTNGDLNSDLLDQIIAAGVDSLNFSLHATTPEDFRKTQILGGPDERPEYYNFLMKRKISNIERARSLVRVKLNTVVISEEITGKVIDYAIGKGIPLRLMRNLNNIVESDRLIDKMLFERGLQPIKEQIARDDSGGSGTVYGFVDNKTQVTDIKVKKFGDVYLDSICEGCPLKNTPRCRERFYGMRIGVNTETLKTEVRLCLDRDDSEVVIDPKDVFEGKHYRSLKANYIKEPLKS